jgi:Leucine-rich repeat (LRR) protein
MMEEHYYWIELFLEKCSIVLSGYQNDRNILNKAILEEHLDDLINYANKSGDISAHQTLAVLILQVGAKLPDDLKEKVLESLEWENDNKRYRWPSYVINVRKIYLEDFRQKIINYKINNTSFLINLRRIHDDKELEKTIIGLEQLNSYSRLKTLEKINYINLDSCRLTDIPEEVFKFSNLSALSLDNNCLIILPDSIINLHSLRRLYLSNNKIITLPSNIGSLSSLKSIYLSYNQIESLPLSFGNLKNLRSLYLNNNNLKSIPDIFKPLRLSIFNLRNNPIKEIPIFLRESSRFKKVFF